jgi:hypothetical protein
MIRVDSQERVWRAVEFKGPDRIPFEWYRYGVGAVDLSRSDIAFVRFIPLLEPRVEKVGKKTIAVDEWGCEWVSHEDIFTMGQPLGHPLQDWTNIDDYVFPELDLDRRLEGLEREVKHLRALGKYIVGSMSFGIWERLHFLRGLEEAIIDLYSRRDRVERILEELTRFKIGLVKGYSELGVDCVNFTDDWGTQTRLMVSQRIWVDVFKRYYERIFGESRRRGMHVYMHSCGNINAILGDLIEIGLNIVQLDAPHQCGLQQLNKEYSGRISFNCCIDIQKVLVQGIAAEIFREAGELIRLLAKKEGGFIARQYPQLAHIGVAPALNGLAYEAFMKRGTASVSTGGSR